MGLYDSIHTGRRCGQVKCLGKCLGDVVLGDHRVLHVIPQGQRAEAIKADLRAFLDAGGKEYDPSSPTWLLFDGEISDVTSWQIKTRFGYIKFIDGVFTSWDEKPNSDLPVVDNYGAPLDDTGPGVNDTSHNLGWEEWGSLEECFICHQLISGVDPRVWREAWRAKRQARQLEYEATASTRDTPSSPRGIIRRAGAPRHKESDASAEIRRAVALDDFLEEWESKNGAFSPEEIARASARLT